MRIGIDVRCLAQGKNTGVEAYTKKLLTALFDHDRSDDFVLFFNAWKGRQVDLSWAKKYPNVHIVHYAIPNKLLNVMLWLFRYPRIDRLCGGLDVFFMPNPNFIALSSTCKLYLTVHDLSFEHCKETFSLKRRLWHFFVNPRLLIRRAEHIFAVSEYTRRDICHTYDISRKKISVTPNGLTTVHGSLDRNNMQLITVKEKYDLPYNFILFFGTIEPRKNIINLIKAFTILREERRIAGHKLVIAGAHGWRSDEIYQAIKRSSFSEEIIVIQDVDENEKEAIFALSSLFVYPSFFEGFGFPPLEAMVSSVPVITSHTTAMPETTGLHAIMIDPERLDELIVAIDVALSDKSRHEIDRAQEYALNFGWSDAAKKIASVIC